MGRRAGSGYAGPRLWLSPDTRNDSFHFLSFVPISTTMASFDAVSAASNLCRMLRHGQHKRLLLAEILGEERCFLPILRWVDGGPSPGIEG